jgi:hypothetical protein
VIGSASSADGEEKGTPMAARRMWRRTLAAAVALAAMAVLAPAASASIGTPTLALSPTSAAAASTGNLGTDIKFSPSGGDSVKNLALQLPAGLIANASVDGGACLNSATPLAACVVGTGTVGATENILVPTPLSLPAEFTLVKPPSPSDLAGLAVSVKDPTSGTYQQLGSPADVVIRPASDPAGFGLDILFSNIPDTYTVLGAATSISVTEINGTFDGLRFPSSCPATPANVVVASSSYSDPTVRTVSAPLTITGCGSLPFSPGFKVTAARDSADHQVQITTDITQGAGQASPRSVGLTLPSAVLGPNLAAISQICSNPASGTCKPVGSATATSPLYPKALSGEAYLTGTPGALAAPSITLVFPPPFGLTLSGAVNLSTNSTTFTGVPDIPLSDLRVVLNGGSSGVFASSCTTPSGTATSTLVSQNGDKTVTVPAAFTVSNCTPPAGGGGSATKTPKLSAGHVFGLLRGQATLGFRVSTASGAPKLSTLTVRAVPGLTFIRQRVHKRLRVVGVTLKGAKLKSVSLSHGRLLIKLTKPASAVTVMVGRKALRESRALRTKAQHSKVKSLALTVVARDAKGKSTTVHLKITNLGLPS